MEGYDDDNDGGLRYQQEMGEAEELARRQSELLEAHRKWLKQFWQSTPSGFGLTKPKKYDNEKTEV